MCEGLVLFTNWPLLNTIVWVDVLQQQLASWLECLKQYDYDIQHRARSNIVTQTIPLNDLSGIMENAPCVFPPQNHKWQQSPADGAEVKTEECKE